MSTERETVIVIGSGPTGAVAAHRLVGKGVPVTLLDAGQRPPGGAMVRGAGNILFRRYDKTLMSKDRHIDGTGTGTVDWYSSLSNGGLSNYWTAAVPRFAPDDFTEGGRLDERYVWPVRYEELVPHYEVAEKIMRVTTGAPITGVPSGSVYRRQNLPRDWSTVVSAGERNGHGLGLLPMANGDRWMAKRRGTEFSSYHCVVAPLESSPLFTLRSGAHVTRLLWNPAKGLVDEVEFVDRHTGVVQSLGCRGVVLAAGTIDSTAIVLRSTSSDFPTGLGDVSGLVGRYLTDHPREWWQAELERPMRALTHPIYLARRPHAESAPLLATSHTVGLAATIHRLRTYVRASASTIGVQVFGTQVPSPDLGVQLDTGDGPDQRVRISLAYDTETVQNLTSGRERLREVLAEAGLKINVINPTHDLRPGSSVHFAGTIRMHHDPQWGVLDGVNRMHHVPNVVVSDMSAFTTNPEKNPTLTAMALSVRAADRLADDLS